jgi:tetratricopeptide (TPR) repeat protein
VRLAALIVVLFIGSVFLAGQIQPLFGPLMAVVNVGLLAALAHRHRRHLLLWTGSDDALLPLLESAEDAYWLAQRARLHYRYSRTHAAIRDFKAVLVMDEASRPQIYTESAQVYFAAGSYAQARQALQSAQALNPDFHPALAWLAIVHYASRDFEQAHDWWQQASHRYPRYARLDGTNWVTPQPGWLTPPVTEAQTITALLNAMDSTPS